MRIIPASVQPALTSCFGTQTFRIGSQHGVPLAEKDPQDWGARLGQRVQEAGVEHGLQGSLQREREKEELDMENKRLSQ